MSLLATALQAGEHVLVWPLKFKQWLVGVVRETHNEQVRESSSHLPRENHFYLRCWFLPGPRTTLALSKRRNNRTGSTFEKALFENYVTLVCLNLKVRRTFSTNSFARRDNAGRFRCCRRLWLFPGTSTRVIYRLVVPKRWQSFEDL